MRRFAITFFVVNLLLASFYLDVWRNANTTSRILPVVCYFEEGTFRINKYHELTCDKAFVNGNYYTDKAPLPTYLMIPVFGALKTIGLIQADSSGSLMGDAPYLLGGFLFGSLPFTLFIFLLYRALCKKKTAHQAIILSMLPVYGSFFFVFAGSYFAHLFSGLLLVYSYLAIKKDQFLLAGFLAGLAFLSEYNLAVWLLMVGIMILVKTGKFSHFFRFSLGILPSLIFLIYYNALFSSSPFTFMYKHHNFSELEANYGFVLPGFDSIWGLSFSPYRGMFFYVPFLLFVVGLFIWKNRFRTLRIAKNTYLVIPLLIYYIFISSYFAWWGGWTYGPRLLLAPLMVLVYEAVIWLQEIRYRSRILAVFLMAGLVISFIAKITISYSAPTGILNPFYELGLKQVLQGMYNPNNILSMFAGVNEGLAALCFVVLFTGSIFGLVYTYKRMVRV